MSGSEVGTLITSIDQSIADSDLRIQTEVALYVETNWFKVSQQIAQRGFALVPTFAGEYKLTEEQLRDVAQLEAAAV